MKTIKSSFTTIPDHKTIVPTPSIKNNSPKLLIRMLLINLFNLRIARSEQEQEFSALVAVPFVCSKWSNFELLLYKYISNPSIMHSVDGFWGGLFSRVSFSRVSLLFGNILTMSYETRIVSLGNSFTFYVVDNLQQMFRVFNSNIYVIS